MTLIMSVVLLVLGVVRLLHQSRCLAMRWCNIGQDCKVANVSVGVHRVVAHRVWMGMLFIFPLLGEALSLAFGSLLLLNVSISFAASWIR